MGETRCQIIIVEGNLTYAAVEEFAIEHNFRTSYLEASIKASCDGTHHASLYLQAEGEEIEEEFTQPIINLHKEIIKAMTSENHTSTQDEINDFARRLFRATRKLYLLYGPMPEDLISLNNLIK